MQDNTAKFFIITVCMIAIVISFLLIFHSELTPIFDNLYEILLGIPKTSDTDIVPDRPS